MRVIGRFDPQEDMTTLAAEILRRITRHRRLTESGSFVLGDERGDVYVLADEAKTTAPLVDAHMPWYVGSYAIGDKAALPSAQDILDDLVDHFASLVGFHRSTHEEMA